MLAVVRAAGYKFGFKKKEWRFRIVYNISVAEGRTVTLTAGDMTTILRWFISCSVLHRIPIGIEVL